MNLDWSDIIGQIIATALAAAIIGIIGLFLNFINKRLRKSKNWFGKNWKLLLAILAIGTVIYQIYSYYQSYLFAFNALLFTFAIFLIIMLYVEKAIESVSKYSPEHEQNILNQIEKLNLKIKSLENQLDIKITKLQREILLIEVEKWKTKKVHHNVLATYIEILNITSVSDYDLQKTLDGINDAIDNIIATNSKINAYYAVELRNSLKKLPDEYSEIAKKILTKI